jgi:hypothetical protein
MKSIEDYERIVQAAYPNAHPTPDDYGYWSISTGYQTANGSIRIPLVGWHETIQQAWEKAAGVVQQKEKVT